MRDATEGAVIGCNWRKTDPIHRNYDFGKLRRITARVFPGNQHIHPGIQRMRERRRIGCARIPHAKAVIADTEVENCASVIGVGIEQGDEGVTISKGIV